MLTQILGEPESYFSNLGISVTAMKSVYQRIPHPPQTVKNTLVEDLNLTHYKCSGFITVRKRKSTSLSKPQETESIVCIYNDMRLELRSWEIHLQGSGNSEAI